MKKILVGIFILATLPASAQIFGHNGDCTIGGQRTITQGLNSTGTVPIGSTTKSVGAGVMASYPLCHVAVFDTGTSTPSTIFSDSGGDPLGNPFTANSDGSFLFFAASGCYDITISSGTGPTLPVTRTWTDVCVGNGGVSTGTVTLVTVDSASLNPLMSASVSNPGTTPQISFAFLAAAGDTVFGNCTDTSASPNYCFITQNMLPFTYTGITTRVVTAAAGAAFQANQPFVCTDTNGNATTTCPSSGVTSWNARTGDVTPENDDYTVSQVTGAAPLNSPNFTGTPTAPTQSPGDNSTKIATTAYVDGSVAGVSSFKGRVGAVVPQANDYAVADVTGAAPLASPVFTGTPAAPTAAADTNTTQVATTAYYVGQASASTPIIDGTGTIGTSKKFARADHVHPTDTSRAAVDNPTFTTKITTPLLATTTNCGATGSAANPSLVACSAAPVGAFTCDVAASTGTCVVSTTAVTANSEVIVQQVSYLNSRLSVTCNTSSVLPSGPLVTSISAGTSFTIALGTVTTNPGCFVYSIVN